METIRRQFPLLATTPPVHYLDNAATSLMPESVLQAMNDYDYSNRANVGRGVYDWAEKATEHYEKARLIIAHALSAQADEIVFTSGATAALNLLASSLGPCLSDQDHVWIATDNHHSNIIPWQIAQTKNNFTLRVLPVHNGRTEVETFSAHLSSGAVPPKIIAVSHSSNVTGATLSLKALKKIAEHCGAWLIVDGAQAFPHLSVELAQLADFYIFSGHKCYGPNGIGVLASPHLHQISPAWGGGGMVTDVDETTFKPRPPPHCFEAGTPPITQAIGLAAAILWRQQWIDDIAKAHLQQLYNFLYDNLSTMEGVHFIGQQHSEDIPILSFSVDGIHPHDLCQLLAAQRVAARGGHHCAKLLMRAINIEGCVRLSLAAYNNQEDCEAAIKALKKAQSILK